MVVEAGRAETLPPHDIDAEEAVIASLLVDSEAIYKVAPRLKAEDFFREKNAWVYDACRALWDRSESINQITVAHELARRNRLEDVGGAAYLSRLVTDLPTSVGVEHYAGMVVRDAIYRRVISASGEIARIAYVGGPDVTDVRSRGEALLAAAFESETLRDFVHIRELLTGYLESVAAGTGTVASDVRAITTGFMDLDTLLTTGLKRGDLVVVAARPSLGKTSLVLNFAKSAAERQSATVAFFSIEMAAEQLVQRMLAMESAVDSARLAFGQHSDRDERRISQALGLLSDLSIYFDDSAMLTVAEMRSKARNSNANAGASTSWSSTIFSSCSPGPATRTASRRSATSPVRSSSLPETSMSRSSLVLSSPVRPSPVTTTSLNSATSANRAASSRTPTSSCSSTARTSTSRGRSGSVSIPTARQTVTLPASHRSFSPSTATAPPGPSTFASARRSRVSKTSSSASRKSGKKSPRPSPKYEVRQPVDRGGPA